MGPSLHGVFDRASGQARAFTYSAALQGARLQWNEAIWTNGWQALPPCFRATS